MQQSEHDFYIDLGHRMRQLRRKSKLNLGYIARRIRTMNLVYLAFEKGKLYPTPYQIYLFMATVAPDMVATGRWPYPVVR